MSGFGGGVDYDDTQNFSGLNLDDDPLADLDDPNDDFDPLELLQSPLFGENKEGADNNNINLNDRPGEDDFGGFSNQDQQQGLPDLTSMPPESPSLTSSSSHQVPVHENLGNEQYSAQASPPLVGSGFPQQFKGGAGNNDLQKMNMNRMNMNNMAQQQANMNGMQQNNLSRMSPNMQPNMATMTPNMPHQNMNRMHPGNQMGPAGMNPNMNPAMMNQMNHMQAGNAQMQQAMQMQAMQAMKQGRIMQMNPIGNPMQAGGSGPGMGNQYPGNQNLGHMGPGGMPNMGPGTNGQGQADRSGSLNNAVNSMNSSMNGLTVSGGGGGMGPASFHGSLQNIQSGGPGQGPPQRMGGGSLPSSPNPVPTVAQMSASVRSGSSRTGPRARGPTPKVDANGKVIGNSGADPGITEAMEKLCESMRRSAMSRNLVKQLSGRSVQRQGSSRSLSRSNSGTGRKMANRSLSGNLGGDDGSGRGTPTRTVPIRRLSDAKHRLHQRAAPGNRGAFRTNSMGSQRSAGGGQGNPKTFLQLDDQSLGAL